MEFINEAGKVLYNNRKALIGAAAGVAAAIPFGIAAGKKSQKKHMEKKYHHAAKKWEREHHHH